MEAAEIAQAQRDTGWNAELGLPLIPPGTHAEWEIVQAIDAERAIEQRRVYGERATRKVAL